MPSDRKFSLLSAPTPLPDDEEEPESRPSTPAHEPVPTPAPDPEPAAEVEPGPAPRPASTEPSRPSTSARKGGRPMRRRRGDDEGPKTVRLDDRASAAMWESYVEAKRDDPFVTYVEHASRIVMDGIDREKRRRR